MKPCHLFLFLLVFVLAALSVCAELSLQFSDTICKPKSGSACTGTVKNFCFDGTGKSGSIPVVQGETSQDSAKKLFDKLFANSDSACAPQWKKMLVSICPGGSKKVDCWTCGNKKVCVCGEGTNAYRCCKPADGYCAIDRRGSWTISESVAPNTIINVGIVTTTEVPFSLSCSDPDSGCAHTFFKVIDISSSCSDASVPYVEGLSGSVSCGRDCQKKVCFYSVDSAGNTESVKARQPQSKAILNDCSVAAEDKLSCESVDKLACSIKQSPCLSTETAVLYLSSLDFEQAASLQPGTDVTDYPYSLCCSLNNAHVAIETASDGANSQFIISLSADSEASLAYDNAYDKKLFFPNTVSCSLNPSELEVLSFAGKSIGKELSNPLSVSRHQYLCMYNGALRIAECCGGTEKNPQPTCNSTKRTTSGVLTYGGIRKKTGEFIIHNISNHDALYYCTSSFNWTTNLDLYDNYTCKSAGFF
ncbi:MAG: hypothetical protein V1837_00935, partial [Candidatus Woesearchaeota archaeon]